MSGAPAPGPERPGEPGHDPEAGRSTLRRRLLVAAPVAAVVAAALAFLLWPAEPKPAPPPHRTAVHVDPNPPPPLRVEQSTPSRPRPKPKRRPKPPRRLRIRIDRNAPPPVFVSVPSVGISAPVIPLGVKPNGKLEVPKDFSEAGWRENGPEPGERGAAMITGHVDSKAGPAAFYALRRMRPGDDIKVRRKDGSTATFVAQRTEAVPKDSFPTKRVYGKTPLPTLRLVTCGGSFDASTGHYRDNIIIYATRKPS